MIRCDGESWFFFRFWVQLNKAWIEALFSSQNFLVLTIVALSFVFNNYFSIMD